MSRRLAATYAMLAASAAWACPVCGAATDTKGTYISMTLVMSGLPLLMIGGVVFFVGQRFRRASRDERLP
jgi:hypothetical protein